MSLGVVNEQEFLAELERLNNNNKPTGIITDIRGPGKPNGKSDIPVEIKKLAAQALIEGASHKEITEALGISQPVTNSAARGMSSSNTGRNEVNPELKQFVDKKKDHVKKKAFEKIHLALGALDKDKIGGAKARDIAGIAKDMASVVKMMEPDKDDASMKPMQNNFVFMVPPMEKKIEDYQIVEVRD